MGASSVEVSISDKFNAHAYGDAIAQAKAAIMAGDSSDGVYYWGILAAIYAGDFSAAIDIGTEAVKHGSPGPVVLNALGAAYSRIGAHDFSMVAHDRAFRLAPDDVVGRLGLAKAAIACGDVARAVEVAGRNGEFLKPTRATDFELQNISPDKQSLLLDWPFGRYQLGRSAFLRHDFEGAVTHFKAAFDRFIDSADKKMIDICGEYLCNAMMLCRAAPKFREVTKAALPFIPRSRWRKVYIGADALADGNYRKAVKFFIESQRSPHLCLNDLWGVNSVLDPDLVEASVSQERARSDYLPDEVIETARQSDLIIIAACDGIYLRKYSNLYVGSMSRLGEKSHVHIHVMNAVSDTEDTISALRSKYPGMALTFSIEEIDRATKSLNAVYASRRFNVALEMLTRSGKAVFTTDIDLCLEMPVSDFVKLTADGHDVGLMSESRALPWFKHPACIAYFSPSSASRDFLRHVAHYVDLAAEKDTSGNLWFVDQNALFSASLIASERGTSVANLSEQRLFIFSCYTSEGRDAFTEKRSRDLNLL